MEAFSYEACNKHSERFAGELEAETIHEAAQMIRRKGLWVVSLHPNEMFSISCIPSVFTILERTRFSSRNGIGREATILFLRQMSVLLQTGMPIHQALQALVEARGTQRYTQLIQEMLSDLMNGSSLSDAMEKHPGVFSTTVSSLTRAGEMSGTLEQIFASMADFLERDYRAREKLKTVMMYPLALLAVSLFSMGFMTVFVMPTLALLLQNLHAALPLPTRILLFLSNAMQQHFLWLLLFLFLHLMGAVYLYRQLSWRRRIDRCLLFLPVFGSLKLYSVWRGVLETLAVLLHNGIALPHALDLVAPSVGNRWIRHLVETARRRVLSGHAFCTAWQDEKTFPRMLASLIAAGERSGELERMLEKAAEFAAVTAENRSARIQAMAEPVLILIVGGIVFLFVLSIILPLIETMDVLT